MSKITCATAQGFRPYQEDTLLWDETPEGVLLGVFDGHGGDEVSRTLARNFPAYWASIDGDDYSQALVNVFEMAHLDTWERHAGSTASLVFIPKDEREAYIAVLGDSPVMAERADGSLFLGPDHNARSNQEERSKAIVRGGVYAVGYMWNDYSDLGSGLQMTRALGDSACNNFLDRTPEVFRIPLGSFLLIASDGLFDPTHTDAKAPNADDILACIRNDQDATQIVQQRVDMRVNDNVTAILWRR